LSFDLTAAGYGRDAASARRIPIGDAFYRGIVYGILVVFILVFILILTELIKGSALAFRHTGFSFLYENIWNPVTEEFGALAIIWGTLYSSFIALFIAVPIGLGAGIFLAEYSPNWLRSPVKFLIELLAAIPSVIYGLWALFFLVPLLRTDIQPFLGKFLGFLPFFRGVPIGVGMLAAGAVLAVMVLPFIVSITYEVVLTVPRDQREGAFSLGATKWETIRSVVLGYGKQGIIGGIILAFGRAFGETMAVTMVIGNVPNISLSVFDLGNTMASLIANEFAEASSNLYLSHLMEIGLILLLVAIVVNSISRMLIWSVTRK
jgi:phosphate transport system permease protein